MEAFPFYHSQCILGEGPLWLEDKKCFYWVDIERGTLFEYNWLTKSTRNWFFDYKVTMVIESTRDHLILALNTSIARFKTDTGQLEWLVDIEEGMIKNRCNDGACDNQGRLWIGTMHRQHEYGAGSLYCIDSNLRIDKKMDKVTISNGIAWSLDNKHMYYIDSPTQKIQSFIFDEFAGKILFDKTAVTIPVEMGTPDGMAIDSAGMLWVAHWNGYGVYRWNPETGQLLTKIDVPAPQITSCAFAGEDLNYLMITTARENMSTSALEQFPSSGDVFIAKTEINGTATNKCTF